MADLEVYSKQLNLLSLPQPTQPAICRSPLQDLSSPKSWNASSSEGNRKVEEALFHACSVNRSWPLTTIVAKVADGFMASVMKGKKLRGFADNYLQVNDLLKPVGQDEKDGAMSAVITSVYSKLMKEVLRKASMHDLIGLFDDGICTLDRDDSTYLSIRSSVIEGMVNTITSSKPSLAIDNFATFLDLESMRVDNNSVAAAEERRWNKLVQLSRIAPKSVLDNFERLVGTLPMSEYRPALPPISKNAEFVLREFAKEMITYGKHTYDSDTSSQHVVMESPSWDIILSMEKNGAKVDSDTKLAVSRWEQQDFVLQTPSDVQDTIRKVEEQQKKFADVPIFDGDVTYLSHYGQTDAHGTPRTLEAIRLQQRKFSPNTTLKHYSAKIQAASGDISESAFNRLTEDAIDNFVTTPGKSILVFDGHGGPNSFLLFSKQSEFSLFNIGTPGTYTSATLITPQQIANAMLKRMEFNASRESSKQVIEQNDIIILGACHGEILKQSIQMLFDQPAYHRLAEIVPPPILITTAEVGELGQLTFDQLVPLDLFRAGFKIQEVNHTPVLGDLYGADAIERIHSNPTIWAPVKGKLKYHGKESDGPDEFQLRNIY